MSRLNQLNEEVKVNTKGIGYPGACTVTVRIPCPVDFCAECIFSSTTHPSTQDLARILDEQTR